MLVICVLSVFVVPVSAEDGAQESISLPNEYYDAVSELPMDVSEQLPSDIYSEDIDEVAGALYEMVSAEKLFSFLGEMLTIELGSSAALLGKLCGVLLLSAVFSALKSSVNSSALSTAMGFCSTCALFTVILGGAVAQIKAVSEFFVRLNSLVIGFIPISCSVWAMGGNVGTAASAGGTLYVFLSVCEVLCAKGVVPVCSLLLMFALCKGISPSLELGGFASALRRCYTFSIGFMMTLLLAVLSSQSVLGAAADGIGARSAKMITATVIPIVGGAVSDTLRTLGASVQYIKSVVGVSAIVFLIILVLPTFVSLLITRLVYLLAGSVASLLGCERESRLIGEIGSVSGMLIAAVSMCSVMFILAFNIFIRSTVAVG